VTTTTRPRYHYSGSPFNNFGDPSQAYPALDRCDIRLFVYSVVGLIRSIAAKLETLLHEYLTL